MPSPSNEKAAPGQGSGTLEGLTATTPILAEPLPSLDDFPGPAEVGEMPADKRRAYLHGIRAGIVATKDPRPTTATDTATITGSKTATSKGTETGEPKRPATTSTPSTGKPSKPLHDTPTRCPTGSYAAAAVSRSEQHKPASALPNGGTRYDGSRGDQVQRLHAPMLDQ